MSSPAWSHSSIWVMAGPFRCCRRALKAVLTEIRRPEQDEMAYQKRDSAITQGE